MKLITAANERYYGPIRPYLESLNRYSQVPVTLACVTNAEPLATGLPVVESVRLPRVLNMGAPLETECPQHGAWLEVVRGHDDEVCIFTDGDIILQRPFTNAELDWLQDWPADAVGMGYNSGPDETLAVEAARLSPRVPFDALARVFGDLSRPCYNIGVVIARRKMFQRIYDAYMRDWTKACDAFGHPARQQWLFVRTVHELGLPVVVTPYSFHANGHYGMPPGCSYDESGLLMAGDEVVALRHRL